MLIIKGKYLDRDIELVYIDKFNDLKNKNLENSVLLLYFSYNINAEIDDFIEKVIGFFPLAIEIGGERADEVFDLLLEKLSKKELPHHIMTKKSNAGSIENMLEDFFIATWPSEENFDVWKKYSIIFFVKNNKLNLLKKSIDNSFKKMGLLHSDTPKKKK